VSNDDGRDMEALLAGLDAEVDAEAAELAARVAMMQEDIDLLRMMLDRVLEVVRDEPEAPGWPPEGYPPSRRHGLHAVRDEEAGA